MLDLLQTYWYVPVAIIIVLVGYFKFMRVPKVKVTTTKPVVGKKKEKVEKKSTKKKK